MRTKYHEEVCTGLVLGINAHSYSSLGPEQASSCLSGEYPQRAAEGRGKRAEGRGQYEQASSFLSGEYAQRAASYYISIYEGANSGSSEGGLGLDKLFLFSRLLACRNSLKQVTTCMRP
jgi:hypothetical protein